MHRFFVSKPESGLVRITGQDAKHAFRVLRLGPGDRFVAVVEGEGQFLSEILEASTFEVTARVLGPLERDSEPKTSVWLFQGMPKGDKMESIVSRCTELGVHTIVPFESSRAVARPDAERVVSRLKRWQKIAQEAAELSGRDRVPEVKEPVSFQTAIQMAGEFDIAIIPWEEEFSLGMKEALARIQSDDVSAPTVMIMIGPEGGFSAEEIRLAMAEKITPVTLGPRMMRTENAGPVALALLLYQFGDMR